MPFWGGRIMGADMRAETARQEAEKAAAGLIEPKQKHGPFTWKLPMQDEGEPAARCYPQGA